MNAPVQRSDLTRFVPDKERALWYAVIINTQLLLVGFYLLLLGRTSVTLIYVYPLIWLNVGAWAIYHTSPSDAPRRTRTIAGVIAVGYFGLLAVLGGMVGPGVSFSQIDHVAGLSINFEGPPGLRPGIHYGGALIEFSLMPSYVIGYAALAYLVYATIIDASNAAVSGMLGLISCLSCTLPFIAALAASLTGGSATAILTATSGLSFGVSTGIFVATVALLYWRPFG